MIISKVPQGNEPNDEEKERRRQREAIQIAMFNQRMQHQHEALELHKSQVKVEALQCILPTATTPPHLVPPDGCLPRHLLSDQLKHMIYAKADVIVDTEVVNLQVIQEEDVEVVGQNTVMKRPPPERDKL